MSESTWVIVALIAFLWIFRRRIVGLVRFLAPLAVLVLIISLIASGDAQRLMDTFG